MSDSGQPATEGAGPSPEGKGDGPRDSGTGDSPRLRHLRAAQLRARAIRGGLIRLAFGTIFLIGAIAHALSPQRHEDSSLLWITLLSLMSTINVALGFRTLARLRLSPRRRAWWPLAALWGVLAVALLGLLLRR